MDFSNPDTVHDPTPCLAQFGELDFPRLRYAFRATVRAEKSTDIHRE